MLICFGMFALGVLLGCCWRPLLSLIVLAMMPIATGVFWLSGTRYGVVAVIALGLLFVAGGAVAHVTAMWIAGLAILALIAGSITIINMAFAP